MMLQQKKIYLTEHDHKRNKSLSLISPKLRITPSSEMVNRTLLMTTLHGLEISLEWCSCAIG